MANEYTLVLANERYGRLHAFRIFLVLLNVILLAWFAYSRHNWITGTCAALALIYILCERFFVRGKWKYPVWEKIMLQGMLFILIGWLSLQIYLVALLLAGWALLGLQIREHVLLVVKKEGIYLQTLFAKAYAWTDLQNIIMRDGLLTLDLRSNKIFQSTVSEIRPMDSEENFNKFCRERMTEKSTG